MLMVPCRGAPVSLATTVTLTEPLPVPVAGETVTQSRPLDAVQAQSPCGVVIWTVSDPPCSANCSPPNERLNPQTPNAAMKASVFPGSLGLPAPPKASKMGPLVDPTTYMLPFKSKSTP